MTIFSLFFKKVIAFYRQITFFVRLPIHFPFVSLYMYHYFSLNFGGMRQFGGADLSRTQTLSELWFSVVKSMTH